MRCSCALPVELGECRFKIQRVLVDDGFDQQVRPGGPVELTIQGPVAQLSETVHLVTFSKAGQIMRFRVMTPEARRLSIFATKNSLSSIDPVIS